MEKQELKHFENTELRTFGRRHGKKLSNRKIWLIENLLPKITPKSDEFPKKPMILEIGFGNGEHLCELAINNPDSVIIGAEPFANGVAALLSEMTNESDNYAKKKNIDMGKGVFGCAIGSKELYEWLDDNPGIAAYPLEYVNRPGVIA